MSDVVRLLARERAGDAHPWQMPAMACRNAANAQGVRSTAAELEVLAEEARKQGFAQGLAEGRKSARAESDRRVAELHTMYNALARPLEDVDVAVEQQLAELAMLVARRVVQAELRLQPEHLIGVVRQAIAALPAATVHIAIHVHPRCAAMLREGIDEAQANGWRIVDDASLQPGDCRIAGADSTIDARVTTRLDALIDAALEDVSTAPTGDDVAPGDAP